MRQKLTLTAALIVAGCTLAAASPTAQVSVNIYPTTQRYLGDESEFNRGKFVGLHLLEEGNDPDFAKFKSDYNIPSEYIGSRRFSYPISRIKNGNIPEVKRVYSGEREVTDFVATTSPGSLFYDKSINFAEYDFLPYIESVSKYVAESFRDEWVLVPKFFEPFNEPMIHAPDYANSASAEQRKEAIENVITYICKYHREVAREIRKMPELDNMQILGFGSAYPEVEANNFGLWESRFKQFIDIAGEDIDILSVHFYDGSGVNNQGGRRTGSNLEAILDILQTYSYIKLGAPMPVAITEYGRLVPNQPEWAAATGAVDNNLNGRKITTQLSNYHPVTNSQAVRSQLSMVMAFMNRQNELEKCIPFTIGKSPQSALYSKSSLWVKQEDGSYDYSQRRYFFEMLKDLKGDLVAIDSDDVDVQTLAMVDGDKLYVMLNNLEEKSCDVALNLISKDDLESVSVKSLKIFEDQVPEFNIEELSEAPKSVSLMYGETVVITYDYKSAIKFKDEVVRTKYYSMDYLKPIEANGVNRFTFEGVKSAKSGEATLRLGVNREHTLNPIPTSVKINGHEVKIERDVVKGYDQSTRKQFFGALEIPFDMKLIESGTNSVEVSYGDKGGYISTAILQLQSKR